MNLDERDLGKVNFISDSELNEIILNNKVNVQLLNKCQEYTISYHGEYIEIKNEQDIKNLMWVSGGFHDGYIAKIEKNQAEELVVLFDGLWGCKIELIFSPDVTYHDERIESGDIWWSSSSIHFDKDAILFVDDYDYKLGDSLSGYTWFKAKNIKYKIIPE